MNNQTGQSIFIYSPSKSLLDLCEAHRDIWQLLYVRLGVLGSIKQRLGLLLEHLDLILENSNLILKVTLLQLINIDNVMISVISNGAPEANAARAVLAEAFDVLAAVVEAPEHVVILLAFLVLLASSS